MFDELALGQDRRRHWRSERDRPTSSGRWTRLTTGSP
jgi:hypothetical protein